MQQFFSSEWQRYREMGGFKSCPDSPNFFPVLPTNRRVRNGYGCRIVQESQNGSRCSIIQASAKFAKIEKGYRSNERECWAVIWACRKYKRLLDDSWFTLRADNEALTWLWKVLMGGRAKLTRWAMHMAKFNFEIEHVPGMESAFSWFRGIPRRRGCLRRLERHTGGNVVFAHIDSRTIKKKIIKAQQSEPPNTAIRSEIGDRLQEKQGERYFVDPKEDQRLFVSMTARGRVMEHYHEQYFPCSLILWASSSEFDNHLSVLRSGV